MMVRSVQAAGRGGRDSGLHRLGRGCLIPLLVLISISSCRKSADDIRDTKQEETNETAADRFLDKYSGQTTDELIALASEYRVDSIVLAFEEALSQKASRLGKNALSQEEQVILVVEALEREVNNGGYHQFFINTPEYAAAVVDALTRIECPATAELTKAAIDALGLEGEPTAEAIEPVIYKENEERDRKLCKLDGEYYEGTENIAGQLFEFIKANQDQIGLK